MKYFTTSLYVDRIIHYLAALIGYATLELDYAAYYTVIGIK